MRSHSTPVDRPGVVAGTVAAALAVLAALLGVVPATSASAPPVAAVASKPARVVIQVLSNRG